MTIRDTFGRYTDVDIDAETWAQLYQSGLIRNGVLDFNKIERSNDNGDHNITGLRNSNEKYY